MELLTTRLTFMNPILISNVASVFALPLKINGGGCGYLVAEQIFPSCLHDMTDDDLKDGVLYTYADPFSNLRRVFLMKGKGIIIPSSVVRHRNNTVSSPERTRT